MLNLRALLMLPSDGLGGGGSGDAGAGGAASGGDAGGGGSGGEGVGRQGPGPGATNVGGEDGGNISDDAGLSGGTRAAADASKPPAPKYKVKRGGKEQEFDADTLVKMSSDDYEHEFRGPGGKPLKLKYSDIERKVQQAEGWEARMREADEKMAKYESKVKIAKGDPQLLEAYLEQDLGLDVDNWARERTRAMAKRDREMAMLIQPTIVDPRDGKTYQNPNYNPTEYNRLMGEQAKSKFDRQQKLTAAQQAQEQQAQQAQQQSARRDAAISGALKDGKVPFNAMTKEFADQVIREHQQLKIELTAAKLSTEVGAKYRSAMLDTLQGMDDATLRDTLGSDFRARMRKLEVTVAKDEKKAGAQQRDMTGGGNGRPPAKVVTEASFNKSFGLGGSR